MSRRDFNYSIPPGFTWDHVKDRYVHEDGRTWDSATNTIFDKNGNPVKTSIELPFTPEQVRNGTAGLGNGPRVTPEIIESAIKGEEFVVRGLLTICILTLHNGFQVTGESACAAPENFNAEKGQQLARDKAKE